MILYLIQKFIDLVYFIFPFINGLKKLLHFLLLSLSFTLLVTFLMYVIQVNNTFFNLKLNVFIIAAFICNY